MVQMGVKVSQAGFFAVTLEPLGIFGCALVNFPKNQSATISHKIFKMAAAKPEVVLSRVIEAIET